MKLAQIHAGDLIEVSKGGRRMIGRVEEIDDGEVAFEPLCRGISYRHATAREVVAHWRKMGRRPGGSSEDAEPESDPDPDPRDQLSLRIGG